MEDYEIQIINKEVSKRSFVDIAFLLDRPVSEVAAYVSENYKENSFQAQMDERRPKVERQPRTKKKNPQILSRRILQDQKTNRDRRNEAKYVTKQIDYSKMKTVRIDDRTYVYAPIDEDPKIAREKYFANQKLPKHISPSQRGPTTEIKKFKPHN
jgi:hypothetical protein